MNIDDKIEELRQENSRLRKQAEAVADANALAAELIVAVEEAQDALRESNEKLRAITDNVEFGFLMVDRKLRIGAEVTKSCQSLFAAEEVANRQLDQVLGLEENQCDLLQLVVNDIFTDFLPSQVSCSQVPARQKVGDRLISMTPSVIRSEGGEVSSLLFSLCDVTELERERRQNEKNKALLRIMTDKRAFRNYLRELRQDLLQAQSAIEINDQVSVRRHIHTIKGNSARYGLVNTMEDVHRVEGLQTITLEDILSIEHTVKLFLMSSCQVLGIDWDDSSGDHHEVSRTELRRLRSHVAQGDLPAVPSWIHDIQQPQVRTVLGAIEGQLQQMGSQRCKKLRVSLHGGDLRIPMQSVGKVLNVLPHVLNNAIVHGIEPPNQRGDKGRVGHIQITVLKAQGGDYIIEVEDDGCGINTKALHGALLLKEAARKRDLECMPAEDQLKLVFVDGLSTLEVSDSVAGRGVGMSAVQECVDSVGGSIEVFSSPGLGARFRIVIPSSDSVAYDAQSAGLAQLG